MDSSSPKHLGLNLAPEVDEALNAAASTTLSSRARYVRVALIAALKADGYLPKGEVRGVAP